MSVAVTELAAPERLAALERAGARILRFPARDGRVPLTELLGGLCREGVNLVLCEGGGELAAGLMAEGLVDEILAFLAPKVLGGRMAPGPVGGAGKELVAGAVSLSVREFRSVGGDLLVRAGPVTPAWRCGP